MIKFISVNIEMDMHYERIVSFLVSEKPDVVCFQEIFDIDMPRFEEVLGMKGVFKPMSVHPSPRTKGETSHVQGLAIFTRFESVSHCEYYNGSEDNIPTWVRSSDLLIASHVSNQLVLWSEMIIDDQVFRIANTHLAVTHKGVSTSFQIEQAEKLLSILSQFDDLIICGDFNAPRGWKTFAMFADKYKDNIPLEYDSSLDTNLHKAPDIRTRKVTHMVDGLFSTPQYKVTNVKLVEGLSDHKAIVANIEKVS